MMTKEEVLAFARQHLVETIVQRVADNRGKPISLEERAALALYLQEVFQAMTEAEYIACMEHFHD